MQNAEGDEEDSSSGEQEYDEYVKVIQRPVLPALLPSPPSSSSSSLHFWIAELRSVMLCILSQFGLGYVG